MHAKTFFFWNFIVWKYNMIYLFIFWERLGRMHENKIYIYIFFFFWRRPGILLSDLYLYNIKIQTNIDQSAVKNFRKSQMFFFKKRLFFEIILKKILFIFIFWAGLDLASPAWSLAPASDQNPTIHARVMFYACMNRAKVINLPSHCSSPSCR